MPFVTSGTATTPPVPVFVAMPAPSRRNQVSTVKSEAPRPGAGPNVTNAFVPPKSIALFDGFESTVIVIVSLADAAPSFAVSCRTYAPWTEKLAVVEAAAALPNVTVPGPLTFVHCVVTSAAGQAVVGDRAGERGRRRSGA